MPVRVIVLRTAGTNCDYETSFAFQKTGAKTNLVHINRLVEGKDDLSQYDILAIPGGFTYGDDIAAGKILANQLKYNLKRQIQDFVNNGKLIIGICNGFQALVKAGFLPGFSDENLDQQVSLTFNDSGKFEDRWVYLKAEESRCVFTKGIKNVLYLPVAHTEGKFIPKDKTLLNKLVENKQVVFKYINPTGGKTEYPWNPNGSIEDIAGICDLTGRVFGLMPHPERHIDSFQHPRWTREFLGGKGDGMAIFENAVHYVKNLR